MKSFSKILKDIFFTQQSSARQQAVSVSSFQAHIYTFETQIVFSSCSTLAHHCVQLFKAHINSCSMLHLEMLLRAAYHLNLAPPCFLWVLLMLTFSELFLSWTYLPSRSISSILILPVAEACWDIWKLLLLLLPLMLPVPIPLVPLPESSSASIRFLLPREERTSEVLLLLLLEVARETVTREEGLGESFNLNTTKNAF